MRHLLRLLLVATLLGACTSAHKTPSLNASGEFQPQQLLSWYSAFDEQYRRYSPDKRELQAMQALNGKSVLILFGSWCHDSEREVARFLKLADASGVRLKQLRLVAVGLDKKDPAGLAQRYNLLYTPTIIVMDDEQELYRMVERPKGPLALDLQQGLTGPKE
jgi:thiol-disulfide isomerase/thioredoxin